MSSFAGRPLRPALLALEDGRTFQGRSFGAEADAAGELVFNTAMTGYQEILTDPSYRGQMVIMTYPHIGNYGIIEGEDESRRPWVEAFIVKEVSRRPSNFRAGKDLAAFLREKNIPGIEGIDTRALTRHIRERGALKAVLSSTDLDEKRMIRRAKESPDLDGRDLVRDVTCASAFTAGEKGGRPLCVAYDLGGKN
ncbi:MAG: carbamoyl-phosphate synthase domain-containing protein, partial [Nitrospinota bacterium]|nr:carbamoyl-phosphate synthase domain-containing protein [Nitrospinota bacterium]